MKYIISIVLCAFMFLNLGGCVSSTETDPRKGGLFGYNPEAYEKRLEERKTKLETTEENTRQAQQEGQRLEASKQQKQVEQETLKKKLSALYAESGKLESQLKQVKAANANQERELARLKNEVAALRSSTIRANNSKAPDTEKQAEITRLQTRMDELLQEAEELSAL